VYAHGADVRVTANENPLYRLLAGYVARHANAVITNSAATAELVRKLGRDPDVISPGVDLEAFKPSPRPVPRRVLYLGGRRHEKGWDRIQGLADTMAGQRLDEVDPRDVPRLISEHDVILMPSRAEPFGLVAAEAIASGRWVVASNVDGLREIVTDGVNGTLVDGDDFRSALARVPDYDPETVASTATRFSLTSHQQAMEEVWNEVRQGSKGRDAHKSEPGVTPHGYWNKRLARQGISSVGRLGLSPNLNEAVYTRFRSNTTAMVHRNRVLPVARAFDVGTGWGYWIDFWQAQGVSEVDASDFTEASAASVSRRFPRNRVVVSDVSDVGAFTDLKPYPLVSCMSVLLHVVDEKRFTMALRNLASVVEVGGYLVVADPVIVGRMGKSVQSPQARARPLRVYVDTLRREGLDLVDLGPAAGIAGDPVDAPNAVVFAMASLWWKVVLLLDRVGPLHPLLARGVVQIDRVAQAAGVSTTNKLLLFRRAKGNS
jgi:hypothetical protein